MRVIVAVLLSAVAAMPAFALGSIKLDDMKSWTIVVAPDAIPSEQYAAREFKALYKQATGAELPIAAAPNKDRNIYIGSGAALASSPVRIDVSDLEDEGLRIRVKKNNIAIAGGRPRGTLYGVYEFFEQYVGARYLTYDDTYMPADAASRKIPRGKYSYVPPFSFRWSYYRENAEHPDFAARLRTNTVQSDEKLGGSTPQTLIGHSLYKWINPEKFGKTHPEYFALVNGKRLLEAGGGGPEVCSTNPDVIKIVTEGVLAELAANPNVRNISVSQNDNNLYCRCPQCKAVDDREGTPMGSHLQLVNAVAEQVEKQFPNVKVGTLAYWYTRKAPKTFKPRPNIQVQLCSIECCTLHAINDPNCARNRAFCRDMTDWKRICNDIWIWNYNTNFHHYDLPFPNLRAIGPNVKFFLDNNAKGVFMQANAGSISGEMNDLRNYVMSECLWKPGADSWKLTEEFCRLHYGAAARTILDYLTMSHDNAEAKHKHPGCFPKPEDVGLTPEVADQSIAYFDKAMKEADSDAIRARVEKASICAYKAAVMTAKYDGWQYGDGRCTILPQNTTAVIGKYIDLCNKYNVTMASEQMPESEFIGKISHRIEGYPAIRLENAVWRLTVLPGENGKMVDLFHKPSGRQFIDAMSNPDLCLTSHELLALAGYSDTAPKEFQVVSNDASSLTLKKTFADGGTLVTAIALKPDAPGKVAFSSTLTHRGADTKSYQFKSRPELNPGSHSADCNVVSAWFKTAAGWAGFNRDWKGNSGPLADTLTAWPAGGALAFYNHADKFGLMVSYDPKQVSKPGLMWEPEWPELNLELSSNAVDLKPGQELRLDYQFEFLAEPPK